MSEGEHAALQRQARIIKHLLSELVTEIPSLHENYKFFNDSFVFHDKDYLKYLSKEANEVKGLLSVYKIRFWSAKFRIMTDWAKNNDRMNKE